MKNMIGTRYGKLRVLTLCSRRSSDNHLVYLCRCDCGSSIEIMGRSLRDGSTKSCGCFITEWNRKTKTTHGMRRTVEYSIWIGIKTRCFNKADKSYQDYGARGITMCNEWRDSFESFYKAIGPRPEGTTIDRIDNRKGYEPGNIRWATASQQQTNREDSYIWYVKGQRFNSGREAARFFHVTATTIQRWVCGYSDQRRGNFIPPKENCSREKLYGD